MKLHVRPVAILAGAALVSGDLLTASPATAAENPASAPSEQQPLNGPVSQLSATQERALSQLENATDRATGVFDAEAALPAGVSESDVADYAAATGPGAPAGGIVAAAGGLVAAGAGIIAICKAASREKQAIYLNVYVTGGVGCWGQ